ALGTVEPRKDLPTLVRAFDLVAGEQPDLHLVVAGPPGWGMADYERAVAAASHRSRIVRLGYVSGDDRAALLASATVFAYPSLYEGFGLPPLEAMLAGVPVVTTDAGALPEVVGDAAEVVGVGDAEGLARALAAVISDEGRRGALIDRGRARTREFSWERSAEGLVGLYRDAAEDRTTTAEHRRRRPRS
ncbi:MAG TPA: glycosyltransferase family 1 protein, partial [Acidimicrobiales bacterium]|nr:glycosyltransferase family 1 protein [Acidimicrobiales bacterium]